MLIQKLYNLRSIIVHNNENLSEKSGKEVDFNNLAEFFNIFSDPTRLRILFLLIKEGPMCVTKIGEKLALNQPAVSWQMRVLRMAQLVTTKRDRRFIRYAVSDKHVKEMIDIALNHIMEGGK